MRRNREGRCGHRASAGLSFTFGQNLRASIDESWDRGQGKRAKIASERLGHGNIGITPDTYSQVLPDMQRAAADDIDAALFGYEPRFLRAHSKYVCGPKI